VGGTAALTTEAVGTGTTSDGKAYTGDTVSITGTAVGTFNSKDVLAASTVTYSGLSLTGAQAGNYTFTIQSAASQTITAKTVTLAASKTYDGSTSLTSFVTIGTGVGSETLTYTGATANDSHVATASKFINAITLANGTNGGVATNYVLPTLNNTNAAVTITAATLTPTLSNTGVTKVYDGATSAPSGFTPTWSYAGLVSGDTVAALSSTGTAYNNKDVGSANKVTVSGLAITGITGTNTSAASDYVLNATSKDVAATVSAKTLTLSGFAADATKIYDGATTATISNAGSLVGLVTGDVVTVSNTGATYADRNVDTGKTVTLNGISLGSTDAGNYTIAATSTTSAAITAKALTITGMTATSRTYDGSLIAALTGGTLATGVDGEALTFTGQTGVFADKNVATGIAVTVTGTTLGNGTGGLASNYSLTQPTVVAANISAKALTVTATVTNKVYDGNTTATGTGSVGTLASTDSVLVAGSQTFTDKNVGTTNRTVSASGVTIKDSGGVDMTGNYAITYTNNTASTISQKALVISGITATSKIYDGNAVASVSTAGVTSSVLQTGGMVAGDNLTVSASGNFRNAGNTANDKNAANGKTVALTSSYGGTDVGNYSFTDQSTASANITARALTVTATGTNKVYDGLTTDTVSLADDRVSGDVLTLANTVANFADKNVGTAKTVSVSGIGVTDTDAGNYSFNTTASTTADITARALTVSASFVSKTYDGTTSAIGNATVGTLVSGDSVNAAAALAFTTKDAGTTNKTVQASGLTLKDASNADMSSNYTLNYVDNTVSTINPAPLTVRANNDARFVTLADTVGYSGVSYTGLVHGETSGTGGTAGLNGTLAISRTGADVAAGTYTGVLAPSGLIAANYTINYANGDYTIVPANQLLVKVANVANTYGTATTYAVTEAKYLATDGSTIVNLTSGVAASGNSITITDGSSGNAAFTIGPYAGSTSGAGILNVGSYALAATGITETSNNFSNNLVVVGNHSVAQKSLTATATGVSKAYDGNTGMTGVSLGLTGKEALDVVTVSGAGAFFSKNAGTSLDYSISNLALGAADAANYYLSGGTSFAGSDGTITTKTVTLSASKTYDGNATLGAGAVTVATGVDSETLTYSAATASDTHVVTAGKYINAITLGDEGGATSAAGGLASNYQLPDTTAANAGNGVTITAAALTSTASIGGSLTKVYDGTNAATGASITAGAISGAVVGDTLTLRTSGVTLAYNGSHVVGTTAIVASGASTLAIGTSTANSVASDYSFTAPTIANTTASITAATLTAAISNTGVTKVYDGGTSVPSGFTPTYTYSGFVGGDTDATLSNTGAVYDNAHVANASKVTVSGLAIGSITGSNTSAVSDYVLNATSKFVAATITALAQNVVPPPPPNVVPATPLPTPAASPLVLTVIESQPAVSSQVAAADAAGSSGAGGNGVVVSLVRESSTQVGGIITVLVSKDAATTGSGFTFQLPAQIADTVTATTSVVVTLLSGDPLPDWLRFVPETNSFVANAVPVGAFPLQVVVSIGGQHMTVVISESSEQG